MVLFSLAVLLVVALVSPVGANMLLRAGFAGVAVTEPEILILLGAAMVAMGAFTRRFLNQRRLLGRSGLRSAVPASTSYDAAPAGPRH